MCTEQDLKNLITDLPKLYENAFDKNNNPIYKHALRVYENLPKCCSIEAKMAALCHDLIEDTNYKLDYLTTYYNANQVTCDMIQVLTRDKNIGYQTYINQIIKNNLPGLHEVEVVLVKLSDLWDNLDEDRLYQIKDKRIRDKLKTNYCKAVVKIIEYLEKQNKKYDIYNIFCHLKEFVNIIRGDIICTNL